jgi:hypothetical protein
MRIADWIGDCRVVSDCGLGIERRGRGSTINPQSPIDNEVTSRQSAIETQSAIE